MREHCAHVSNILAHLDVLFSCSKGSEVKEKHFRVGVYKMPSLNHTEQLWKLCAGYNAQQNQMILGVAAALPAQLGPLGTGAIIWRMTRSSLAEFLVSLAPESPPVSCFQLWLLPVFPVTLQQSTGTQVIICFWGWWKGEREWDSDGELGHCVALHDKALTRFPLGNKNTWPRLFPFYATGEVLRMNYGRRTAWEWCCRWEAELQTTSKDSLASESGISPGT